MLWGKPLQIWGRCPELVELVGVGSESTALFIREGASGSEAHGLAVGGPSMGVGVSSAENVGLQQLWIRDNAGPGVVVLNDLGPASVHVAGSLIEDNQHIGVYVSGTRSVPHLAALVLALAGGGVHRVRGRRRGDRGTDGGRRRPGWRRRHRCLRARRQQ